MNTKTRKIETAYISPGMQVVSVRLKHFFGELMPLPKASAYKDIILVSTIMSYRHNMYCNKYCSVLKFLAGEWMSVL